MTALGGLSKILGTGVPVEDLVYLDRDLSRSLSGFVRCAWNVLEPGTPYQHGWHIDAISEHLEAVTRGQLTRLLINLPPGMMKSTLAGVMWPAWMWGPGGMPDTRFIGASHEAGLATRDNRRTRLLVESEWFQRRWPVRITSDQNEKTYFENEARGFRQSCAVASMTGRRGNVVLWDDPQSPEKANSQVYRETAIRVLSETLPSRMVSPRHSAIVVIMQRLHEEDVSGYILSRELGYEHLCLPMEFEPERRCVTSIGWEDPRIEEGELLFPERFPREVVERDKKAMGSFATAGQFQQRPVPREGGLFKRHWLPIVDAVPAGLELVRGWDLAATKEGNGAFTVGVLMGKDKEGRFYVLDVVRVRETPGGVIRVMKATAERDDANYGQVNGSVPKDPGAAGKAWSQEIIRSLAGHAYSATPETGDKLTRAEPFAAQAEAGNVALLRGDWNEEYIAELTAAPHGKYMDQVDASSRAFSVLVEARRSAWMVGDRVFA